MVSPLNLPAENRPRERLLAAGAAQISDTELLAVLLGSGTTGTSVFDLAAALLAHFDGLRAMAGASESELRAIQGIGRARAGALQAAFELGRRASGARPR